MSNAETNTTPRTPPKQNSLQVLGDTGRVSRSSRSDQRSGLESHRLNAMKDVAAELVEVPALDFCKHYLSSDLSTEKIKGLLQRIPNDVLGKDGWVEFSPISKSDPKVTENDRFKKLETIVEAICIAAEPYIDSKRTVGFTCRPNNTTLSEITGGSHRIDAFFYLTKDILRKIKNVLEWLSSGVVCNAEFKLSSDAKEVAKNRSQLVGAAAHFMNNDPRRLHMYSLSIEGDNVRLWYFSRSHSVKSTVFSLHTDTDLFAQFVIALSFPKDDVLGFDETITRKYVTCPEGDEAVEYHYSIGGETYKTIRIISEFYASSIPGRGTRVWLVEKVSTGVEYVLKDYWLDKESKTEKEIQTDIFKKLKDVQRRFQDNEKSVLDKIPDEDRAVVGKALKHYSDYFVAISEEQILNYTTEIYSKYTRCGAVEEEQPKIKHSPAVLSGESSMRTGQTGNPMERISGISSADHSDVKRQFAAKKHCRILYEEYCDAAFELTSLRKIIYMLNDSLTAIQLLYLAGYIHRDISCGNVLCAKSQVADAPVVGKLSDLEYTRPFNDPNRLVAGDPKTGTPAFMAVDVQSRQYTRWSEDSIYDDQPPFRHSYLHDLESLFWLALWLFTTRGEAKYATEGPDSVSRMNMVDDMFSILNHRRQLIYAKFNKDLFQLTFPQKTFPNICEAFATMRIFLRFFHSEVGTIKRIGEDISYSAIFTQFRECFTKLEKFVLGGDITVQKVTLSQAPKEDDNNDDRKIYNLRPRDIAPRENPPRRRVDLGWTGVTEGGEMEDSIAPLEAPPRRSRG